ncbi:MAG: PrpF family protein [Proteobacteria bacterium]|nr:PrpF family protein [Pseudomonadota bacterium]
MTQTRVPAVFIRGGTSKGVFFHGRDLPAELARRNEIFLAAIGSPDPYGRQLDGLGGGISSLSKVVVIEPSRRPGIDVDYTFGQVVVDAPVVDYGATCGNLSSAVGPFAVDEGLVAAPDGEALVRVYNTNTEQVFESRFTVAAGKAQTRGDFIIPGVAGAAARIRLDFLDPAGSRTGALLPSGQVSDLVTLADGREIEICCIDATTPCVFAAATDLGLTATELPGDLETRGEVLACLEEIRALAGARMGLGETAAAISGASRASPKIAVVGPPAPMQLLDGSTLGAAAMDLSVRMISMGQPHRAVPLTGGMCLAVAANLAGSLVHRLTRPGAGGDIRLGTPSGAIPIGAKVHSAGPDSSVERITTYRTARRLMEGSVLVP